MVDAVLSVIVCTCNSNTLYAVVAVFWPFVFAKLLCELPFLQGVITSI